MENILLPSKIEFSEGKKENEGIVIVEPCHQGYGTTLGNALRRVLLSSLPGAAVTAVKIKDAPHEFGAIPNVKEDVVEIILNLKQLRLRVFSAEPVRLILKAKGEKVLKAEDILKSSDVEIVNPDLHLVTLTNKSADFEMEIFVSQGRGYVPTESQDKKKLELGVIAVDSIFTPIRNVGYKVEDTRVGQITNYDKLTLNIETDGTIAPKDAFKQAVVILMDHFRLLGGIDEEKKPEVKAKKKEVVEEVKESSSVSSSAEATEDKEEKPKEEVKEKKKRGRPKKVK
jgi:DNA-directed RNA polymerase subunit alpha